MYRSYTCVPVSEGAKATDDFKYVCEGNFASRRFFDEKGCIPTTKEKILKENRENTEVKFKMILDYFWLENDYYTTRYGGNWAEKSLLLLSKFSFDSVLLPRDEGIRNTQSSYTLQKLPDEMTTYSADLQCQYEQKEEVPLWVASNDKSLERLLAGEHRGSNTTHSESYLPKDDSFLCITMKDPGPPLGIL